jgi:hypothetical protein
MHLWMNIKVHPFADMLSQSRRETVSLLVNRETVGPFKTCQRQKDLKILGDLLESIDMIVEKLGWQKELNQLMQNELIKNVILFLVFYLKSI